MWNINSWLDYRISIKELIYFYSLFIRKVGNNAYLFIVMLKLLEQFRSSFGAVSEPFSETNKNYF